MTTKRAIFLISGSLLLLSILAFVWMVLSLNRFQVSGNLDVNGLRHPVEVFRDDKGIAHIVAGNQTDLFFAQGFVTAQHRLFQMEYYRYLINGQLSELVGEDGYRSDVTMRVMDLRRNAREHAARLDRDTRDRLAAYARGVSAYVREYQHEHHLELRLLGIEPRPMGVEDIMAIVHFVAYSQTRSYPSERMFQRVVDAVGAQRAGLLLPLGSTASAPVDWTSSAPGAGLTAAPGPGVSNAAPLPFAGPGIQPEDDLPAGINLGSNAWAVGPGHSASGQAILANDPHLDARVLPGIWHPVGLYAPGIEAVGVAIPGIPGLVIGRNREVAFGVTNGYADVQDLYVETVDPDDPERYLDNGQSRRFLEREETIRIRDDDAPGGFREQRLVVRSTRRGPVISDHPPDPQGRVLSLRWSAAEEAGWEAEIGLDQMVLADSVDALEAAARSMSIVVFNLVYAGRDGEVGFRATGRVPVRADRQGQQPRPAPTGEDAPADDWSGWIPPGDMPGQRATGSDWVAVANHDTRGEDYPYYYSAFFAPPYRKQRLEQLIGGGQGASAREHWDWMQDIHNPQAEALRPYFLAVLDMLQSGAHGQESGAVDAAMLGVVRELLADWNLRDDADLAAPLIYQAIYRQTALLAFTEALGGNLGRHVLGFASRWQPGLDRMIREGELGYWLSGSEPADGNALLRRAVLTALEDLSADHGGDPAAWRWGDAHTILFTSPMRPEGFGRDFLGGGRHAYSGSGATLRRAAYAMNNPFQAQLHDSLRVVIDFAEEDRIMAVVAGGVVGRQFSPHFRDQLRPWLDGTPQYWWYGEDTVREHAISKSVLVPHGR